MRERAEKKGVDRPLGGPALFDRYLPTQPTSTRALPKGEAASVKPLRLRDQGPRGLGSRERRGGQQGELGSLGCLQHRTVAQLGTGSLGRGTLGCCHQRVDQLTTEPVQPVTRGQGLGPRRPGDPTCASFFHTCTRFRARRVFARGASFALRICGAAPRRASPPQPAPTRSSHHSNKR